MLECVSQPHHQQWLTCHTAHYTSNQTLNLAVMQTYKQGTGDSSMFISNIRFLTEASPSGGPSLSALDSSPVLTHSTQRSTGRGRLVTRDVLCGGVGVGGESGHWSPAWPAPGPARPDAAGFLAKTKPDPVSFRQTCTSHARRQAVVGCQGAEALMFYGKLNTSIGPWKVDTAYSRARPACRSGHLCSDVHCTQPAPAWPLLQAPGAIPH